MDAFGILGFSFGMMGFVFAMSATTTASTANVKTLELEGRLAALEKKLGETPATGD